MVFIVIEFDAADFLDAFRNWCGGLENGICGERWCLPIESTVRATLFHLWLCDDLLLRNGLKKRFHVRGLRSRERLSDSRTHIVSKGWVTLCRGTYVTTMIQTIGDYCSVTA